MKKTDAITVLAADRILIDIRYGLLKGWKPTGDIFAAPEDVRKIANVLSAQNQNGGLRKPTKKEMRGMLGDGLSFKFMGFTWKLIESSRIEHGLGDFQVVWK